VICWADRTEEAEMRFLVARPWAAFGDVMLEAGTLIDGGKDGKLVWNGRKLPSPPPADTVQALDRQALALMLEHYGHTPERHRLVRAAPGVEA
jgi:hypothetical protein